MSSIPFYIAHSVARPPLISNVYYVGALSRVTFYRVELEWFLRSICGVMTHW
jgi:hypothetical protein